MPPTHRRVRRAMAFAMLVFAASWAAACGVSSGARQRLLLELYTSQGCSSCPPADRALAALGRPDEELGIVALALHVDYWDDLGWRDAFAQPAFDQRQRWLVEQEGERTVATPQFFVSGRLAQDWPSDLPRLRVMVAVTQSHISSRVSAGENHDVTLHHDHVVRWWSGPQPLVWDGKGQAGALQHVRLDPGWTREQLRIAGWVEDAATGRALQAVDMGICRPGA